jgi:hypothetical protein
MAAKIIALSGFVGSMPNIALSFSTQSFVH